MIMPIKIVELKKRKKNLANGNQISNDAIVIEESGSSSNEKGVISSSQSGQIQPKFKMVYTYKYIFSASDIIDEEEEKQEQSLLPQP